MHENNWLIDTKNGKGKLPLFHGKKNRSLPSMMVNECTEPPK